jgi:hypothetical protein
MVVIVELKRRRMRRDRESELTMMEQELSLRFWVPYANYNFGASFFL